MRVLQAFLVGGAFWAIAAVASAACDCTTPPCTGTSLSQRSPQMGGVSASACDGCDSSGVSTLAMDFTCNGGACTCGRYVTGDYWILDPNPTSGTAGVNVSSVSPAYRTGRNGLEINPNSLRDPFDARSGSSWYDAAKNQAVPFVGNAGQSLVKGVSLEPNDGDCGYGSMTGSNGICVHSFFVVTVVGTVPPADAYRPPYYGTSKPTTVWRDSQINWALIPSFDVTTLSRAAPSLASVYERIRGPQVDHWRSAGGYFQQTLGLVNTGYGRTVYGGDVAVGRSEALCRTLGPEPLASGSPSRRDVLRGFVQHGIDTFGIIRAVGLNSSSSSSTRWMVAGGHGAARKHGIAVAATLLNDPEMRKAIADWVAKEAENGDHMFNEDGLVWRSPTTGRALLGELCPQHSTSSTAENARYWWSPGDYQNICRDPDGLIDGGNNDSGLPPGYMYGFTSGAVSGGIFGALVPQVKAVWANPPFFELSDRLFGYTTIPGDTGAPGGMWADDNCTNQTPSSFSPYSGCVRGTGRMCGGNTCESYHGAAGRGSYGGYTSPFCEAVWERFRVCADNRSAAGCSGFVGLSCGDTVCAGSETATSCPADCSGSTPPPPDSTPPTPPTLIE